MRSKVIMFLIFKFKRFIPLRIRKAKAVTGCDEKLHTCGKNCSTLSKSLRVQKEKQKENREAIMEDKEELK